MHSQTLLLVDDNPENLILLELLLACENFNVQTATSAREALQALAAVVPDGMLTDIQMPDVDGLELTRQVRQDPRTRDIPILAVSANAMKENIQEAYAAGCDGYITKPIDTRTFAGSVREHLAHGRIRVSVLAESAPPFDDKIHPASGLLAESLRGIRELINLNNDTFRRKQAADILHQCAGSAGVLGYPQVAALARHLESQSVALSEPEFVDGLGKLADLLTSIRTPR